MKGGKDDTKDNVDITFDKTKEELYNPNNKNNDDNKYHDRKAYGYAGDGADAAAKSTNNSPQYNKKDRA